MDHSFGVKVSADGNNAVMDFTQVEDHVVHEKIHDEKDLLKTIKESGTLEAKIERPRIKQIATCIDDGGLELFALSEDGDIYWLEVESGTSAGWSKLPAITGGEEIFEFKRSRSR